MSSKVNRLLDFIRSSFDTHSKGASARKTSAFWMIMLTTALEIGWLIHSYNKGDFSLLTVVVGVNLGFVATALGMTTYETIKKIDNENKNIDKTE